MLSYIITHFNRPYFLDIHIQIIRKYAPTGTQIVVADDSSRPDVVDLIKKMPIDNLFVQKKNSNKWKKGSYSSTLSGAVSLCSGDFLAIAEDDFFFSPIPIMKENPEREDFVNGVMPEMQFPSPKFCVFTESLEVLNRYPDVMNIQIARDSLRVPVTGEIKTNYMTWNRIDSSKKCRYYCTWPAIFRMNDFKRLNIPTDMSIWAYDKYICNEAIRVFGQTNWGVVPDHRHYAHVGYAFSQRTNDFILVEPRTKAGMLLQQKLTKKVFATDLEAFNEHVLDSYVKGVFRIDFKMMEKDGLVPAFNLAFSRV